MPTTTATRTTGLVQALERLRRPASRQELCDVAADAVASELRFDRGYVFCLADGCPIAISVAVPRDREAQAALLAACRTGDVPLGELAAESGVIRRRRPALADGSALAPLLEDGRPIGWLRADGDDLGDEDLAILQAFAVAVGMAFERAAAVERAHRQALAVRETAAALEAVADGALKPASRILEQVAKPGPATSASRLAGVLTRRELEVLGHMAAGQTNAEIAAELVVSPGTVKSHVKQILRKLHVANRAQAVATYMRLAG